MPFRARKVEIPGPNPLLASIDKAFTCEAERGKALKRQVAIIVVFSDGGIDEDRGQWDC